ncbi:MAG: phosphoenolpyruvate carboxylase, partial [Halobacteriovoraceae bacterium]|nr:phosphoenolpyruvate carboxylase [Halobacteriovoraceae bacterium]
LQNLYKKLNLKNSKRRHQVAHAFTLMMEIINACEASYRTFRLRESKSEKDLQKQDGMLIYVLTAHPTEARTPQNIDLFHRIQNIMLRILEKSGEQEYLLSLIKHNLKLAWILPITRHEKPQVVDEAKHIFSIIMRPDVFNTLLRANRDLGTVRVRTWVGGDKDGHPGVDEKVMKACLQASRDHFVEAILRLMGTIEKDIAYLDNKKINLQLKEFNQCLKGITTLRANDYQHVEALNKQIEKFSVVYQTIVGADNPRLRKLKSIIELFPGLVIPIEIREDSEIIKQALNSDRPLAIERMLTSLKEICGADKLRNYAQGMIISMCESYGDVLNAMALLKRSVGNLSIPVIPLFETAQALEDSSQIVAQMLANKTYCKQIKNKWNNRLEIMLGYSDSSKGMGVLASRLGIARTMRSLDLLINKSSIQPIFFHGSGGSVGRGGGSVQEQTSWWPKSALQIYKATIQGEMVERNFSSSEVTLSGVNKILSNLDQVKSKKGELKLSSVVESFAKIVELEYVRKINDNEFFKMVESATPYSYLNVLKLGSRPSKRAKEASLDFNSTRAIPWVLCWTQTRTLFPTWWGVGTAWKNYKKDSAKSAAIKSSYKSSAIFSSFVRVLGFTLSKVDLNIFQLYLSKSNLSSAQQEQALEDFQVEYKLACQFVIALSGDKNLLWFKPWLNDSIELRSSMIHPLNILQIIGNKTQDLDLVRKSVAGISSGMMTTG